MNLLKITYKIAAFDKIQYVKCLSCCISLQVPKKNKKHRFYLIYSYCHPQRNVTEEWSWLSCLPMKSNCSFFPVFAKSRAENHRSLTSLSDLSVCIDTCDRRMFTAWVRNISISAWNESNRRQPLKPAGLIRKTKWPIFQMKVNNYVIIAIRLATRSKQLSIMVF